MRPSTALTNQILNINNEDHILCFLNCCVAVETYLISLKEAAALAD
jgi:hypothetical protein